MNMVYIKNIRQENGVIDYKGLDTNTFIPGTQIYFINETNSCCIKLNGEVVIHNDIEVIDEAKYHGYVELRKKLDDEAKKEIVDDREEYIEDLENELLKTKGVV